MPTRLNKVSINVFQNKSVGDNSQIPAVAKNVAIYRQGAEVSANVSVLGSDVGKAVAVYDTGRLAVGDTVGYNLLTGATATVASIVSPTSITLSGNGSGTLTLLAPAAGVAGSYLIPTNARPSLYADVSGTVALTGSPTPVTDSDGLVEFYTIESQVTAIIDATKLLKNQGGGYHQPNPWIDIRDYGNDLAVAYAALPSSGGTVYLPAGTYTLSAVLTIAKNGTVLLGDHDGNVTIKSAALPTAHHLIELSNVSNCLLKNIQLDGQAAAVGNFDCLRVINSGTAPFNNRFENVYISNARRNNLRIEGAFDQYFRDCDFNYAMDHATYIDLAGSDDATHIQFENCEWNGNDRSTLKPVAPLDKAAVRIAHGYDVSFFYCRFEGNRGGKAALSANGIYATTCPSGKIIGCHFEISGDATNNYYPTDRPNNFICLEGSSSWLLLGNTLQGSTTAAVKPTYGYRLYNSGQCFISGGRIVNMDTKWMLGDSATRNVIIGARPITGDTLGYSLDKSYIENHEGVKVSSYTDDADRAANASTVDGTIIHVVTPGAPANKLQVRLAAAWVGITGT